MALFSISASVSPAGGVTHLYYTINTPHRRPVMGPKQPRQKHLLKGPHLLVQLSGPSFITQAVFNADDQFGHALVRIRGLQCLLIDTTRPLLIF